MKFIPATVDLKPAAPAFEPRTENIYLPVDAIKFAIPLDDGFELELHSNYHRLEWEGYYFTVVTTTDITDLE